MIQPDPASVNAVAGQVTETGRVFASGGIDGLILFALVLGTFLFAIGLMWSLWMLRQQTRDSADGLRKMAEAAHAQAEANKDLATAIAAVGSADMTFKQALASSYAELRERIAELEARAPAKP